MASFLLAHLSDPHLAPLPRARLGELASKRALGFVNWRRKRRLVHRAEVLARIVRDMAARLPDHIAVTGDLVNISLSGEYPPARHFLESLGLPTDVTVVPGNHDVYVRGAAGEPGTHWGAYMRGDDASGPEATADEPKFPFLRRRGALALIGLSSAVPTAPFMATGRLGGAQLERLGALLARGADEERFRVVLLHHPPVNRPARYFKRLVDEKALRAVLAKHGAELVLHGHDHVHAVSFIDGPRGKIPVVGVPSASAFVRPDHDGAGYNLYCIDGTPGAWRCELVSRGLAPEGAAIVELKHELLLGR
jgi:3',5'-cyclic AMP phosphodiesterase CpdA